MRSVLRRVLPGLAGLALVTAPGLASAECTCTCTRGRSVPVCSSQSLVEPICQQICTDRIEQSLGSMTLSGGGGGGGGSIGSSSLPSGISGADAAALKSLLGR